MSRHLIVAGIDFGTSFTKVVVRDNNTPGSKALVVDYPGYSDGLLPSVMVMPDGRVSLANKGPAGAVIPYLKMVAAEVAAGGSLSRSKIKLPAPLAAVASNPESRSVIRSLLALYLAHVMAATESFLRSRSPWKTLNYDSSTSGDHLIFQLAVPSGLLSDGGRTEQLFREALMAGFELREQITAPLSQSVDLSAWSDQVNAVCADLSALASRHSWQCLIYPEVAAAVQAIFRAPNAGTGLHITMDVGAGTVDLNAFRRINRPTTAHQAGRRALDYYSALVAPLGIQHLKDPHQAVAPQRESDLMQRLRQQIKLLHGRAERYQPSSVDGDPTYNPWSNTTVYLFGGGAHYPAYKVCLEKALHRDCAIRGAVANLLPKVSDLQLPKRAEYGRFAVAYGLSFFRVNLDRVNLPHELKQFRELYPDKKMPPIADYSQDD